MLDKPFKLRGLRPFLVLIYIAASILLGSVVWNSSQIKQSGIYAMAAVPTSPRTYQEGSRLYLDNGTVKVGLESSWGGAIVEFAWHGVNFVNAYDTGREVQAAFYDGDAYPPCGDCRDGFGWDPVQAGDAHKHGSPVLAQKLGSDFLYTKTRPHHWYPDNKGGGKDQPVPGDVDIEQWVTAMAEYPSGMKLHYKITYLGRDQHANHVQEFPAVYVNWDFGKFVHYDGSAPWTSGEVTSLTMPGRPKRSPMLYTPEHWGAFVNDQGIGLTVFTPGQYPYVSGWKRPPDATKDSGTHYFLFEAPFSFGSGSVLEGDIYLFGGDYKEARRAIYSLEKSLTPRDVFPPLGVVDQPKPHSKSNGSLEISGWAIDNPEVSQVKVYLDNRFVGAATYGGSRPDISAIYPHAPIGTGFRYKLDTTQFPNGAHLLGINAEDKAGIVAVFPRIPIEIENANPSTKSN